MFPTAVITTIAPHELGAAAPIAVTTVTAITMIAVITAATAADFNIDALRRCRHRAIENGCSRQQSQFLDHMSPFLPKYRVTSPPGTDGSVLCAIEFRLESSNSDAITARNASA
jgi:hypothetical protein